ncbi:MAG: hypothetical protein OXH79_17220 [Boseongicola sp.]|nr:hypothetical protein [Boseongicola sp.]
MEFLGAIGPVGGRDILVLALAVRFGIKSRNGASRLDEAISGKQANSASNHPPTGMQA